MPGTVVFKPIEANITRNTELIGKMDPYCLFHVGSQKIKSAVCRKGGKHPQWEDSVVVPITDQPTCVVDLKDKDIFHDDKIGSFEVDLREVETQGRLKKWYPLFHKTKPAGEILIEAIFTGDTTANANIVNSGLVTSTAIPVTNMAMPATTIQQAPVTNTIVGESVIVDQTVGVSRVVAQNVTTTNIVSGGMQTGYTNIVRENVQTGFIGGAVPTGIMGGNIPSGNIYGAQGMTSQLGDSVLPVVGGHYPSTHSSIYNPVGVSGPELYAQEALLRGVDPLNISHINRHNDRSGLGYSGASPFNQFGGLNSGNLNNGGAGTFDQRNIPINTTSQQIPSNIGNKDLVIEEARNL